MRGSERLRQGLALALPAMMENLMVTLLSMVDTAMVGSLGKEATAAAALNASPSWLVSSTITVVGGSIAVIIARLWGAKDYERAGVFSRQAMVLGLLLGALLTLAGQLIAPHYPYWMQAEAGVIPAATAYMRIVSAAYIPHTLGLVFYGIMRGAGDMKTPMRISLSVNLLNVLGNFLLIYPSRTLWGIPVWGAGLGVAGAALSTAVCTALSAVIGGICLSRRQDPLRLSLRRSYRPEREKLCSLLRLGIPMASERVIINLGQVLFSSTVSSLGTLELSAHHLAITAEGICYNPAFGISVAATTGMGHALGAGKEEEAKKIGWMYLAMCAVVMVCVSLLMWLLAPAMIGLFTPDEEVIRLGAMALRIVALAEPLFGLSIVGTGILRSAGETVAPLGISIVCMMLIRVPLAMVFSRIFDWGLAGAWIAMDIDLIIRGGLTLARYASGKWKEKSRQLQA
ncbi:MAG: MATE family efflux transporter [Clostridia bacterium]|nr:MATE family efflux transporter [Clostridia bacterium]